MMRNNYVLLAQKYDSMEFDKDELIGKIKDFDEFDREGLSIRHLCTYEIANSIGVSECDVFITKLDWNYHDNTKYLAKYCVSYYYDEEEIRQVIEEYAQRFETHVLNCKIDNKDEVICINVTFVEGQKFTDTKFFGLSQQNVYKMLKERYPKFDFDVKVTFRLMFWFESFLSKRERKLPFCLTKLLVRWYKILKILCASFTIVIVTSKRCFIYGDAFYE